MLHSEYEVACNVTYDSASITIHKATWVLTRLRGSKTVALESFTSFVFLLGLSLNFICL